MKTKIYYFSGTGNSMNLADCLADKLKNTTITSIGQAFCQGKLDDACDCIGLVFPVYAWGMPPIVVDFCKKLTTDKYVFVLINYASNPGHTLKQIHSIFNLNKINLGVGYGIDMPDNCIPLVNADPKEKQIKLFDNAEKELSILAKIIREKRVIPIQYERTFKNWILSQLVYKLYVRFYQYTDIFFRADIGCNSCGICVKICPVENIEIVRGKPNWKHNCQSCLACIQWCPKAAIQYGQLTLKRNRYHNRAIAIQAIIGGNKFGGQ